jgi:hypothetical protein
MALSRFEALFRSSAENLRRTVASWRIRLDSAAGTARRRFVSAKTYDGLPAWIADTMAKKDELNALRVQIRHCEDNGDGSVPKYLSDECASSKELRGLGEGVDSMS